MRVCERLDTSSLVASCSLTGKSRPKTVRVVRRWLSGGVGRAFCVFYLQGTVLGCRVSDQPRVDWV